MGGMVPLHRGCPAPLVRVGIDVNVRALLPVWLAYDWIIAARAIECPPWMNSRLRVAP